MIKYKAECVSCHQEFGAHKEDLQREDGKYTGTCDKCKGWKSRGGS